MPTNLFDQEDPRDWSDDRRRGEFETFVEDEVVGSHCEDCQYTPAPVVRRGSLEADLVVVGDYTAPADQKTNRPFSGPAGKLLKDMLAAIDRDWEKDCYITNALLCDGTEDAPRKSSVEACHRNLARQLDIVSPTVVLAVGKYALQSLYREPASVTLRENLGRRGSIPGYPSIEGIVSFNPAYILRQPENSDRRQNLRSRAWDHLKTVRELLDEG